MKKLKQADLDSIIARLTKAFAIEQIFVWTLDWEGVKYYMLHILLRQQSGQSFTEANIYAESVVKGYGNVDFVVCYPHEMKKKIKQGLGRTVLICQPDNLVYQHPEAREAIQLPDIDFDTQLASTRQYFEKEFVKIRSFIEGYQFYFDRENYGHAAFMLHQVTELAFRAVEHLMVGEEKRTHCLRTHQNYAGKFACQLGNLFRTNEHEVIIDKLDEAYAAIRYDQNFIIEKTELETAFQLAEHVVAWLARYSAFLLQEMEEKLGPQSRKATTPTDAPDVKASADSNHRDVVMRAIERCCTPTAVRCFGYRQQFTKTVSLLDLLHRYEERHRYYLLVVLEETRMPIPDLQSSVNNLLPEDVRVTLILFTYDHLQGRRGIQNIFRQAILSQSEVWYEDRQKSIKLSEDDLNAPTDKVFQTSQWRKAHQNAIHLCLPRGDDLPSGSHETACYNLALAVEQVCLGLIRVFWQFQPPSTNLRYLMQLCGLICPEAASVFVLEHACQRRLFQLLLDAQQKFRHAPNYRTEGRHLLILEEYVLEFINIADKCVVDYLREDDVFDPKGEEDEGGAKQDLSLNTPDVPFAQ